MPYQKGDRVAVIDLDFAQGTVLSARLDGAPVSLPVLTIALDNPALASGGVWCAREWEVLNPFQLHMLQLDCELTGHPARQVAGQMHHKPASPEKWFTGGREWYLSDGGYSRVWIDAEDGHLFLGGNSTDRVKAAWPASAALIAAIEAQVRPALRASSMIL